MQDRKQLSIEQLDQIRDAITTRTQEVADAVRALEQIRNALSILLNTIDKMTLEQLKLDEGDE